VKGFDDLHLSGFTNQKLFNVRGRDWPRVALLVKLAHQRVQIGNTDDRSETSKDSLAVAVSITGSDARPGIARTKSDGRICKIKRQRARRAVVVVNGKRFVPPRIRLARGLQPAREPTVKSLVTQWPSAGRCATV